MGYSSCIVIDLTCLHKRTHTMILVCAVDYSRKYRKMWKRDFYLKNSQKIVHKQKFRGLMFFSSRLAGFEITCTSIRKKCPQNPFILHKFDFCTFEPEYCEVIENSFKAPFTCNFSPLKCTYLGQHSFHNISA